MSSSPTPLFGYGADLPLLSSNQPPRPDAVAGPYTTPLDPQQEQQFQTWVKANNIPWQDTPNADYDMRGYWKAQQTGDPTARTQVSGFDGKPHFPDMWKTPYHRTFSNQSMYAKADAPSWSGDVLIDKYGKVISNETPTRTQGLKRLKNNAPSK